MFQNKEMFSFKMWGILLKRKNGSLGCTVTQYFILFWNDHSKQFFPFEFLTGKVLCVHIRIADILLPKIRFDKTVFLGRNSFLLKFQ